MKFVIDFTLTTPSNALTYLLRTLNTPELGGPLTGISYRLPDEAPSTGTFIVDTVDLFAALEGNSSANKRSLEQTCRQLQVSPLENLHNAGNDAHVRPYLYIIHRSSESHSHR